MARSASAGASSRRARCFSAPIPACASARSAGPERLTGKAASSVWLSHTLPVENRQVDLLQAPWVAEPVHGYDLPAFDRHRADGERSSVTHNDGSDGTVDESRPDLEFETREE